MKLFIVIASLVCRATFVTGFAPSSIVSATTTTTTTAETGLFSLPKKLGDGSTCTRRRSFEQAALIVGGVFASANPASAKKDPAEADKEKLKAGYKRLNYLLDNWEKETTNCKTKTEYSSASSPCERTPLNVQYYLGYRSTEDPLFRADKTMRRLEGLVRPDDAVEYLEAMEKFNEKAEEGSGMSYISSWGEANPGGGKDRVELFVNRAKANVIDARDALGVVLKLLDVST